jgi:hypothetical protein
MVIEKGVKTGETVVTEGQLRLEPGSRITTDLSGRGGGRGRGARAGGGATGDGAAGGAAPAAGGAAPAAGGGRK